MDVILEDRAVHIANLSGLRWDDLDVSGQAHYRRLAEDQIAYEKRQAEWPYEPMLMPPIKR